MVTWQFWTLIGVLVLAWLTVGAYLGSLDSSLQRIEFILDKLKEDQRAFLWNLPEEIAKEIDDLDLPEKIAQEMGIETWEEIDYLGEGEKPEN